MTNQKSSGRCWIFACLNVIRVPFIKQFNLEEFEFSQAYVFFWDKVRFVWKIPPVYKVPLWGKYYILVCPWPYSRTSINNRWSLLYNSYYALSIKLVFLSLSRDIKHITVTIEVQPYSELNLAQIFQIIYFFDSCFIVYVVLFILELKYMLYVLIN